jgi:K+-transporting ATPase ATPase C chain
MFTPIKQALLATLLLTLLCGLVYPFAITYLSQFLFPFQAHGSILTKEGKIIGSSLIGQNFQQAHYFHSRPSATTSPDPLDSQNSILAPYNALNSGGSNESPSSKNYADRVQSRFAELKRDNPDAKNPPPIDLVTASASGLDMDISPAAAYYQIPRIAKLRHLPEENLTQLVKDHTEKRLWGLIGEPHVNVLALNLDLDHLSPP